MTAHARARIAADILALAATHPEWEAEPHLAGFTVTRVLNGTHWADCWKSHPVCALVRAAAIAQGEP